jgi:transcription termination/antitermination protein NusG
VTYHVLKVRGASEHAVARRLDKKGIENSVPSEDVVTIKRGRKVTSTKPLLSRYVFARGSISRARSTPGVYDVLRHPDGVPATISEAALEVLRSPRQVEHNRGLRKGDAARVIEGPFKSFQGRIAQLRKGRAVLEVSIFGRPTRAELQLEQLEAVP